MDARMPAAAEGFEFVAVKQEPCEGAETDGSAAEQHLTTQEPLCIIVKEEQPRDEDERAGDVDPTQEHDTAVRQKAPDIPAGGVKREELILGPDPELEWGPTSLPASDEASRDPLASEGHEEPGAPERDFVRKQFKLCSAGLTKTAFSRQVERVNTNTEFSEDHTYEGSSRNNCNATTRRSPQQKFECSSCSSPFASKHSLIHHVFTHMPGVSPPDHVCTVCGEVAEDAESLNDHVTVHENGHREGSGRYVPPSIRRKIPKRAHGCTVCGKAFPSPQSLNIHIRTHSGERPYNCEVCGKAFVQWIHLQNHKVTHSEDKPHRCRVCGRHFGHVDSLKRHLRLHTGETPYRCDICGMSFSLLDKLKTHRQVHTGKKTYCCDICGSYFAAPNSLKAHKRRHTDERPFSCDFCGESFMWPASLKRHKQIHTGEKPYRCNLCERHFAYLNTLKRHVRGHSGERPHSCKVCGATFCHLSSLKTHARVHTGEKPYRCSVCGKCFAVSSHATRHRKVHMKHLEDTVPVDSIKNE